jgi:hypothetical protein
MQCASRAAFDTIGPQRRIARLFALLLCLPACLASTADDCDDMFTGYCDKLGSCDAGVNVADCITATRGEIECQRLESTYDDCTHEYDNCKADFDALTCSAVNSGEQSTLPASCQQLFLLPCEGTPKSSGPDGGNSGRGG